MRVLGVIPARARSKRIPGKNLRLLAGKPLIAWTIEAAKKAQSLTRIVVSTDSTEIRDLALRYGLYVIKQPDEFAVAGNDSGGVCRHALDHFDNCFDYVVLLHPTSPIRNPAHIDEAVQALEARPEAPALASVECRKRGYRHNASIYVMRAKWLARTGLHYCDQSIPFLMDRAHSVDIDDEIDFKLAEAMLGTPHSLSLPAGSQKTWEYA